MPDPNAQTPPEVLGELAREAEQRRSRRASTSGEDDLPVEAEEVNPQ